MFKLHTRSRSGFSALLLLLAALAWLPSAAWANNSDDFFKAAKMDDERSMKALLAAGVSPNLIQKERGETGLMVAVREESKKVFNVLLNAKGVDLNIRARNGDTALMIASYKGDVPMVKALLEKEAEPNNTGWTALHYAAAIGNDEIVQMLLDASAYIDAGSPNNTTPIMMAARAGKILTVKLLLDSGADVTLKNDVGMNAIDLAKKFDHNDIADGLAQRLQKAGKL
ncbi:ankyrin repeat domain-containing protein [Collimonas pratensis]|uniref:Ankyrin repeat family protein n=1 Tax=Collimonas pratensis TaxID=279113 RepID=A0A127Q659_9BURK|nr:ankyrin repeat domain-containing protein [Collimonas pratensis]AMP05524.1 ankyrin repeat family protein [Collimonas pratensis]